MKTDSDKRAAERLFAGPGKARALARSIDWSATPLGPVSNWPQSLRTAVDACLGSRFPTALFWGPHLVFIHNEADIPFLGERYPAAMGRQAPEVLSDTWPVLGPLVANALADGGYDALEPAQLAVTFDRGGMPRAGRLSVSISPVRDESGRAAGVMASAVDLTARELGEQVLRMNEERTRRQSEAELSRASAALLHAAEERDNLRSQLMAAEESERRRIARELHDQLGQHLTGFALSLAEVRRLLAEREPVDARLDQLEALSHAMARDARLLALELRPPELDDIGLESALDTYVEQWSSRAGVEAELTVTGAAAQAAVPGDVRTAIYRIVQEALNNVAKYAHARHVSVLLDKPDGELRLVVEDDGDGCDLEAVAARVRRDRRLGLAGMLERATLVGGTFEIESSKGSGTTIYVRVPLRQAADAPVADASVAQSAAADRRGDAADLTARAAAAVTASKTLTRHRQQLLQTLRDVVAETSARRRLYGIGGGPKS